MLSRKSQIKRQRRRKSIFCQNPPSPSLSSAALFLKDAPTPVWVPCQGKLYKNGHFRYLYNGKVGVVGPRYYRFYPGANDAQLTENIKALNLSTLKNRNPEKFKQPLLNWGDIGVDYYEIPEPVVMTGENPPNQIIPIIDATLTETFLVDNTELAPVAPRRPGRTLTGRIRRRNG